MVNAELRNIRVIKMKKYGRWKHIIQEIHIGGKLEDCIEELQRLKSEHSEINLHIDSDMDNNLYLIDYDVMVKNQKDFYNKKQKDEEAEERALLKRLVEKYKE